MVGDIGLSWPVRPREEGGYYTSVMTSGIEVDLELSALSNFTVRPGDCIYISAGDLVSDSYRDVIVHWVAGLPEGVTIALAASSLVRDVHADWLENILPMVDVFTGNVDQARRLGAVIGCDVESADFLSILHGENAIAVVRDGARGAYLRTRAYPQRRQVASLDYPVVDTLGVGATHTGVFLAGLVAGCDPLDALRRANVAGAMAVSRPGAHGALDDAEITRLAATLS
ncbi:hypothetical protein H8R18_02890 [Nanchangia anserum]|uniref:PfkB family carbohydrate kinase n=1 Tax=Nanchangia anserum TaxID=2692125 RepID=UPI00188341AA|nr:PfkB family carbohydrate kinase [Nanchangia anserum]QOX82294.1 hypothetical protein H8R18_02890 [Nanchangia anserum]